MYTLDHATVFTGPIHEMLRRSRGWLRNLVDLYHVHVFNWLYPKELPPDWIKYLGTVDVPSLWIDARGRRLSVDPPPGCNDGLEYISAEESPVITDLRRALVGPRCAPRLAEIMLGRALKFYLD